MIEANPIARIGLVAAGLAAAGMPTEAEAGIVHKKPGAESHQIADRVIPIDGETRKVMEKWGIEFNGREINLRLDSRDGGRPLVAGEPNAVVQVGHKGDNTVVFRFVERDGGVGTVSIVRGREGASQELDLNVSHAPSRRHSAERGGGQPKYGEYGSVRIYGMHGRQEAHDPRPAPGMKWYYHNPKGAEKEGWWYQAPEGSR